MALDLTRLTQACGLVSTLRIALKYMCRTALQLALCVIVATALLSGACQGAPLHAPQQIETLAKNWFYAFQSDRIDRSQLNDVVNGQLTDDMVHRESIRLKSFGRPIRFQYLGSARISYAVGYDFLIVFARDRVKESIALANGKIAGIDFRTWATR